MKLADWVKLVTSNLPESLPAPLAAIVIEYARIELRFTKEQLCHLIALSGVYIRLIEQLSRAKAIGEFDNNNPSEIRGPADLRHTAYYPDGADATAATLSDTSSPDTETKSSSPDTESTSSASEIPFHSRDAGPRDYLWPEIAEWSPKRLLNIIPMGPVLRNRLYDHDCWIVLPKWQAARIHSAIGRPLSNDSEALYVQRLLQEVFRQYRFPLFQSGDTCVSVREQSSHDNRHILRRNVPVEYGFQLHDFRQGPIASETRTTVSAMPGLPVTLLDLFDTIPSSLHWFHRREMYLFGVDEETGNPILMVYEGPEID